jgi:protein TonB
MTFTMTHGYAVSLVLHGALLLPLIAAMEKPPETPSLLVVELQGRSGDTQSEEEVQREMRGTPGPQTENQVPPEPKIQDVHAPLPPEPKQTGGVEQHAPEPLPINNQAQAEAAPRAVAADPKAPVEVARPDAPEPAHPPYPAAPSAAPSSGSPGREDVKGVTDQSEGETLADAQRDADRMKAYSAVLIKKVQRNLAYPDAGRKDGLQGVARIAFVLEADGRIHKGSLRIAESSGQPALDASALKTVRNSEPFDPPPHPISIIIAVNYGRRK